MQPVCLKDLHHISISTIGMYDQTFAKFAKNLNSVAGHKGQFKVKLKKIFVC